jgi:uncharacterized protein (TIGR04551 family)
MTLSRPLLISITSVLLVGGPLAGTALAQLSPTLPGQPPEPARPEPEEEGVAEEAPEDPEPALPTTPVLPPPREEVQRFEIIQLGGYLRGRGDWFRRLDLGFIDDPDIGGAPFPNPLGCQLDVDDACSSTLLTANMRLRLEPVINIHERASVHAQIDVLDNVVLGSNPDTYFGDGTIRNDRPLDAFSRSQVPPEGGQNDRFDSIRVKRAWGEVLTPLGLIKFGRQPEHWGTGMFRNSGGFNPFNGTYDYDADYGDSVDRLMFSARLPGTNLRGAVARDWASTQPTAAQVGLFDDRYYGQPWNLGNLNDVDQWVFVLSRLDSPEAFAETLAEGRLGLNYGVYFTYRSQGWALQNLQLGEFPDDDAFIERDARMWMPNVWGRLGYGNLELEAEAMTVLGRIGSVADIDLNGETVTDSVDVRQFGGVGRFTYHLMNGDLALRTEVGYASGDRYQNDPPGRINVRYQRPLAISLDDTVIRDFMFNENYNIDLILFRELIGTVTNATYVKPSIWWQLFDQVDVEGRAIASFANRRAATPGNSNFWGVELNALANYRSDGFIAGLAYGILFPGGALDFPNDPDTFGENAGSANIAQTIQAHLVLHF